MAKVLFGGRNSLSHEREGANQKPNDGFFERLKKLLTHVGIRSSPDLADHPWNCDETGLSTAASSTHVLAKRGSRWVQDRSGGSGRSYTTVHGCGSASHTWLPEIHSI